MEVFQCGDIWCVVKEFFMFGPGIGSVKFDYGAATLVWCFERSDGGRSSQRFDELLAWLSQYS
ncbi:hypothetical protein OK016_16855 [Vibrio chagasii]|nr:hypothetical protein [Vibrio chagasii]